MQTFHQDKRTETKTKEPLCVFRYIISQQVYMYIHINMYVYMFLVFLEKLHVL